MYCTGICLEELKKATKNLIQDSQSVVQDLKSGTPEYEAGVLTVWLGCSVTGLVICLLVQFSKHLFF
jgi:hypothetical protein